MLSENYTFFLGYGSSGLSGSGYDDPHYNSGGDYHHNRPSYGQELSPTGPGVYHSPPDHYIPTGHTTSIAKPNVSKKYCNTN